MTSRNSKCPDCSYFRYMDNYDHNPRKCLTHELGSDTWEEFPHDMSENRIHAHAKLSDGKLFIIGGSSSHPTRDCRTSQEVFTLDRAGTGWLLEPLAMDEDNLCHPSEVIIDIPCLLNNSLLIN